MNLPELTGYLGTFIGTLGGAGWIINLLASKRKAKADADRALIDNYEARLAALHQTIERLNATEKEHARRICDLNHALDDKTEQIRKQTSNVWESQQEINLANKEIIRLTEERDYYKAWHCLRSDCRDPRGPKPPRDRKMNPLSLNKESVLKNSGEVRQNSEKQQDGKH